MIKEKELYLALLAQKKIQGVLSEKETTFLERWLAESPDHQEYFNALIEDFAIMEDLKIYNNVDSDEMWQRTLDRLQQESKPPKPAYRISWKELLIAAAVIGIVFTIYKVNKRKAAQPTQIAITSFEQSPLSLNALRLILEDGTSLNIQDLPEGFEQIQGKVKLVKKKNYLQYLPVANATAALSGSNTILVPQGEKYQVRLPDNSSICINAGSRLTLPVQSPDSMRKADLAGEAWCEITHNPESPFSLTARNTTVKVLGTQFNISAYEDDKDSRISLTKGNLEIYTNVSNDNNGKPSPALIPTTMVSGDRAIVDAKGKVAKTSGLDLNADMDWTNGNLNFDQRPIDQIARAVGRRFGLKVKLQPADISGHATTVLFQASNSLADIVSGLNDHYRKHKYEFTYSANDSTLILATIK